MPAEDRRAERRELLLDAALELLGTVGWTGTTVRAVCAEARLNPRYFYESFDDLEALVVAVYDRLVDELREGAAAALAAVATGEPTEQFRAVIEHTVRFVDDDRRRARVLYVEALGSEALNRRRIAAGHTITAFVEGAAASSHRITKVAAAVLVGGFSELLVAWLDGAIDISRAQLVDDATALFAAVGAEASRIASS